jgi:hypothetical protein
MIKEYIMKKFLSAITIVACLLTMGTGMAFAKSKAPTPKAPIPAVSYAILEFKKDFVENECFNVSKGIFDNIKQHVSVEVSPNPGNNEIWAHDDQIAVGFVCLAPNKVFIIVSSVVLTPQAVVNTVTDFEHIFAVELHKERTKPKDQDEDDKD